MSTNSNDWACTIQNPSDPLPPQECRRTRNLRSHGGLRIILSTHPPGLCVRRAPPPMRSNWLGALDTTSSPGNQRLRSRTPTSWSTGISLSANNTREWQQYYTIPRMNWPPSSPDLKPISIALWISNFENMSSSPIKVDNIQRLKESADYPTWRDTMEVIFDYIKNLEIYKGAEVLATDETKKDYQMRSRQAISFHSGVSLSLSIAWTTSIAPNCFFVGSFRRDTLCCYVVRYDWFIKPFLYTFEISSGLAPSLRS